MHISPPDFSRRAIRRTLTTATALVTSTLVLGSLWLPLAAALAREDGTGAADEHAVPNIRSGPAPSGRSEPLDGTEGPEGVYGPVEPQAQPARHPGAGVNLTPYADTAHAADDRPAHHATSPRSVPSAGPGEPGAERSEPDTPEAPGPTGPTGPTGQEDQPLPELDPFGTGDTGAQGSALPTDADWPLGPRPQVVRRWDPPPAPWAPGHRGVDLAASPGTPVHAALDGHVSFAGMVAGRGVVVIAIDGTGLRMTHEPVIPSVAAGQRVSRGEPVGVVSDGPYHCQDSCLHWGLLDGRTYLDPLSIVGRDPSRLLPVTGVPLPPPEHHRARGQSGAVPGRRSSGRSRGSASGGRGGATRPGPTARTVAGDSVPRTPGGVRPRSGRRPARAGRRARR
ncbi:MULTISPECIES: M23 family metallopeptidase [unclassified Streptomyces]|uniref:M23 family metallopeptidase n=1 Tax=unclassified Streptomyces TaxID=2593676 RepID=UPI0027E3D060|nr:MULTISPECIES: M23 family metallopeptidase [unclassified Streptomyces]